MDEQKITKMSRQTMQLTITHDDNLDEVCVIDIVLKEEDKHYDLTYTANYTNTLAKNLHPLRDYPDSIDGEIIYKNTMTTQIIKYLMMPEDTLLEYTGLSTPVEYKCKIMQMIALLWD